MKPSVRLVAIGSFFRTLKAIAWSFVGIRESSEYQKDLSSINPLHVIIVGIGAVLVLVVGLVVLVNVVVH